MAHQNEPEMLRVNAATTLLLAFLPSMVLCACATSGQPDNADFRCYDDKGAVVGSIKNRGECEYRNWTWRAAP
jgi:hypothetical protein